MAAPRPQNRPPDTRKNNNPNESSITKINTMIEHDSGLKSLAHTFPTRSMLIEHDPGPPMQSYTRMLTIGDYTHGFYPTISKRQSKKYMTEIRTMYKRKDRKIRLVNILYPTRSNLKKELILDLILREAFRKMSLGDRD